jgi:phosphoribosylaminoimidazole-succinocarboxamide synthase
LTDNQDRGIETSLGLPLFKKGKTRDVYYVRDNLLINSSDRISAFDVNSFTEIEGKGASLNLLSAWWFRESGKVFPNHYISTPDLTMMLIKKAKRVDIEWVLRNYLYGSLYREYEKGERNLYGYRLPDGLRLAEELPEVMLTPTTKADVGHDTPITKRKAIETELITGEDWNILEEACYKLYEFYSHRAEKKGLIIPDFKIEFGRWEGNMIQIDEAPNHDSARIWIKKHYRVGERQEGWCADKEFYRQFLIDSGIKPNNPPNPLPEIPVEVIREIQKRLKIYEVFVKDESLDSFLLRNLESVESELKVKK